jgi:hypothetical protein
MNPKRPNHWTLCDCYGHALFSEYDPEDEQFYIAVFERGISGRKLTFWQRICWSWHILIRGTPYTDEVCLDKHKAQELANFLKENS